MGKQRRSLIAMLVAVASVGIASASFSFFYENVPNDENIKKAHEQIKSIVLAIKTFGSQYDRLPSDCHSDIKLSEKNKEDYDKLMEILTCTSGPGNKGEPKGNSENIKFLETMEGYADKGYVDPWGLRFNIYLDMDYNHKVKIGEDELDGSVFIYSSGPNKTDEEGAGDDICSWKD